MFRWTELCCTLTVQRLPVSSIHSADSPSLAGTVACLFSSVDQPVVSYTRNVSYLSAIHAWLLDITYIFVIVQVCWYSLAVYTNSVWSYRKRMMTYSIKCTFLKRTAIFGGVIWMHFSVHKLSFPYSLWSGEVSTFVDRIVIVYRAWSYFWSVHQRHIVSWVHFPLVDQLCIKYSRGKINK